MTDEEAREYLESLGYVIGEEDHWICLECNWLYRSPLSVLEVSCPNGHLAQRVEELFLQVISEKPFSLSVKDQPEFHEVPNLSIQISDIDT